MEVGADLCVLIANKIQGTSLERHLAVSDGPVLLPYAYLQEEASFASFPAVWTAAKTLI